MAKLSIKGTSYLALLSTLNGKDRRKIGNNTWLEMGVQTIDVRLHRSIIVRVYQDDVVEINSGGYQSTTTKERINQFLPNRYGLYQKNYEWFVADRHDNWNTIPFVDHMSFAL